MATITLPDNNYKPCQVTKYQGLLSRSDVCLKKFLILDELWFLGSFLEQKK